LSGPNGVGKSAIGLLAHMVCAARGLVTAYIPAAKSWVDEAEGGEGDAFLLRTLWRQNADVIAASDVLRPVFAAALEDGEQPFTKAVMQQLRKALHSPDSPAVGIIVDEVQSITQAVAALNVPDPAIPVQLAGRYFASRWHDWDNENRVFVRLSIASSHGARELKLPDGEARRLRIVESLGPADIAALQTAGSSPAFIDDAGLRAHVAFIAGGILRRLVGGAELVQRKHLRDTKADRRSIWDRMWAPMEDDCWRWLQSMPMGSAARNDAADSALALVQGRVEWSRAKPLFDDGLVTRTAESTIVAPVSPVAAAVILRVTADERRARRVSLSSVRAGAERGYELERQVRDALHACRVLLPAKRLDGAPTSELALHASYALPFTQLADVVARDDPVAYIPTNTNYACDAIVMPATDDAEAPITIIESSVTDPRDSNRMAKVRRWFAANGLVQRLQAAHPTRRIMCALVWDQVLAVKVAAGKKAAGKKAAGDKGGDKAGDKAGNEAGINEFGDAVVVLDQLALVRLGISA
jgi:hypothetical protein